MGASSFPEPKAANPFLIGSRQGLCNSRRPRDLAASEETPHFEPGGRLGDRRCHAQHREAISTANTGHRIVAECDARWLRRVEASDWFTRAVVSDRTIHH